MNYNTKKSISKLESFKKLIDNQEMIDHINEIEKCEFLTLSHQFNNLLDSIIDLSWSAFPDQYGKYHNELYVIKYDFIEERFFLISNYLEGGRFIVKRDELLRLRHNAQVKFNYDLKIIRKEEEQKPKKNIDLYLIHDTALNTLKIGRSKNPKSRLKQLQIATANKLELLSVAKGEGSVEFEVHKSFESLQLNGEWFKYDQSIINYFQDYQKVL